MIYIFYIKYFLNFLKQRLKKMKKKDFVGCSSTSSFFSLSSPSFKSRFPFSTFSTFCSLSLFSTVVSFGSVLVGLFYIEKRKINIFQRLYLNTKEMKETFNSFFYSHFITTEKYFFAIEHRK